MKMKPVEGSRDRKRGKDSLSAQRREARRDKAIARGEYVGKRVERARKF